MPAYSFIFIFFLVTKIIVLSTKIQFFTCKPFFILLEAVSSLQGRIQYTSTILRGNYRTFKFNIIVLEFSPKGGPPPLWKNPVVTPDYAVVVCWQCGEKVYDVVCRIWWHFFSDLVYWNRYIPLRESRFWWTSHSSL